MAKIYRPHEFARRIGKSTTTLRRWDKEGRLTAKRTPAGHRFYDESDVRKALGIEPSKRKTVVYCRVSSRHLLAELKAQETAMQQFCLGAGIAVDDWISEVGSGLDYGRKNFLSIVSDIGNGNIYQLILAHKDRLVRFGFEYFESFATENGCEILVANQERLSPQQELVEDLMVIIDRFSHRLEGLHKYKKLLKQAAEECTTR